MKIQDLVKMDYLHLLEQQEQFQTLCEPQFKTRLADYLKNWERIRKEEKNYIPIPIQEYPNLPFSESVKNDFEWWWKRQSLKAVKKELQTKKNQLILEVGACNGWLSNQLVKLQNQVVAVDLFADDLDGLACKKYYANKWESLQCDTENLHFFKPVFDCIIVNHALSFIPNPVNYCEHLKLLLKPGGKLILLGLNFYADTSLKQKAIHSFKNYYLNKYVFSVFFKDAKGLLSMKDKQDLTKNGFVFEPTAGMFLRNCLAFFNSKKPIYCFGVFKNTAN